VNSSADTTSATLEARITQLEQERDELRSQLRTEEGLIEAGMVLSQELSLEGVLRRIVELACSLVDARFGALGVLDESGEQLAQFITVGLDDAAREAIGDLPTGKGILGVLIHDPRPLRLANLGNDPRSVGFPDHHPPMRSFLGVPITTGGGVRGRIYLTEKQGASEFSAQDERVVVTLATQAAIAIRTAELYEASNRARGELAAANERLEQADRHKSAFLANMSHELRTPLNSIIGYTALLLDDAETLTDEQREDLGLIRSSGTHLLALISDLLDLSRIEAGRLELNHTTVDVAQLLGDVVASLRPQVEKSNVQLVVDAPVSLVIECDRSRVRQMLLNVIGNAVKFTTHGSVTATLEEADLGGVVCTISDTGPGIPSADLHRIFESFFQSNAALARTPREREGAGLGLAITRMLADAHGGGVDIESTEGEGTIVMIRLPANAPAPPAAPTDGGDDD
jgi:signal transduction histidine kinase